MKRLHTLKVLFAQEVDKLVSVVALKKKIDLRLVESTSAEPRDIEEGLCLVPFIAPA